MSEKPILFSGEMVRAILEGRKTQTRRAMKLQPDLGEMRWTGSHWEMYMGYPLGHDIPVSPYGGAGDRLWIRESWRIEARQLQRGHTSYLIDYAAAPGSPDLRVIEHPDAARYVESSQRWLSSIHMPRWASRIMLEIVKVRIERLQEINEADAEAEGCAAYETYHPMPGESHLLEPDTYFSAKEVYAHLWDKLKKKNYPWDSNPFVWVIEFRKVEP